MRYLGGKARIAKHIVAEIERRRSSPKQLYVEPFIGGCNVLPLVSGPRWGNDIVPDLKLLYEAVRDGWDPPEHLSEDQYAILKHGNPSATRALAGTSGSFSGKWFGGYARGGGRNFIEEGARWCRKTSPKIQGVRFTSTPYQDMEIPDNSIVYCDPPYAGVTGYKGTGPFDHDAFWQWATALSQRNTVLVSEYAAPAEWTEVWRRERNLEMGGGSKGPAPKRRIERLFIFKS